MSEVVWVLVGTGMVLLTLLIGFAAGYWMAIRVATMTIHHIFDHMREARDRDSATEPEPRTEEVS